MVFVSGDTARCVNCTQKYDECIDFLYYKSKYMLGYKDTKCEEITENFIPWEFKSTMAYYKNGHLQGVNEFPSAMMIFPKVMKLGDIPTYQRLMRRCLEKSIHHSLWVANTCVYNECNRFKKRKLHHLEQQAV